MLEPHLDPKTQLLIALAAAVAGKCQACFAGLYTKVDDVGVSEQEARAAASIGGKVAAKSHDFMGAFVKETTEGAIALGEDAEETASCC